MQVSGSSSDGSTALSSRELEVIADLIETRPVPVVFSAAGYIFLGRGGMAGPEKKSFPVNKEHGTPRVDISASEGEKASVAAARAVLQ